MDQEKIKGFFYITHNAEVDRSSHSTPKRLILESNPDIFYHDQKIPEDLATPSDHHLFALTKGCGCFQEKVYRNLIAFENEKNKTLHIYPGVITYGPEQNMILRFREQETGLASEFFDRLEKDEGIVFIKDKKFRKQRATIHFEKYVEIEPVFNDIYRDINAQNIYFIRLPRPVVLDEFCQISKQVSYSCKFSSFEPYCAYIIRSHREIEYFFMFYSKHCKISNLPDFKDLIYKEITRIKTV